MKKVLITISSILVTLILFYRVYSAPDTASFYLGLILFLFFSSFTLFLIFENRIKATSSFKKIDENYLSKKILIHGQEIDFPLLVYFALGGNLLSILFIYSIYTDNIPYKDYALGTYLFFGVFVLLLLGSIYLTLLMVRYFKKL